MRRFSHVLSSVVLSTCGFSMNAGFAADESHENASSEVADSNSAVDALEGVILTRPEGDLIQVMVEHNRVVLRFFTDRGEPDAIDVDSGTVRVMSGGGKSELLSIVPSSDGLLMTHAEELYPPFEFNLHINLFRDGIEGSVERYLARYP